MLRIRTLLVACTLFCVQHGLAQDTRPSSDTSVMPDPRIQKLISLIVSIPEKETARLNRRVAEFRNSDRAESLIQQVVLFEVEAVRASKAGKGPLLDRNPIDRAFWLLSRLVSLDEKGRCNSQQARIVIRALVPLLESTDSTLRDVCKTVLASVDYDSDSGKDDFSEYASFVAGRKDNPPKGLIRYMYEWSPDAALLSLLKVYVTDVAIRNRILSAQEILAKASEKFEYSPEEKDLRAAAGEARKALGELVKHDNWCVHLYVAGILRKRPIFGAPEIMERLKADRNELVQEAVARIRQ